MPAGRPIKFKTEKEFVEYLRVNANLWVEDFFEEELDSIEVDKTIARRAFGANLPRIDLIIRTKSGRRIGIECKNPKQHFHELSRSVSQLLAYGVLAEEVGRKFDILAIISSERGKEDIVHKMIKKYSLPIRNFYVDRDIHGEIV